MEIESTEKRARRRQPIPQVERDIHALLASRIKSILATQGVAVKDAASLLNISYASFNMMLAGKSLISAARLKRLADSLGLNVSTFFLFEVESEGSIEGEISDAALTANENLIDENFSPEETFSAIL